jgi:hypothetical protein
VQLYSDIKKEKIREGKSGDRMDKNRGGCEV